TKCRHFGSSVVELRYGGIELGRLFVAQAGEERAEHRPYAGCFLPSIPACGHGIERIEPAPDPVRDPDHRPSECGYESRVLPERVEDGDRKVGSQPPCPKECEGPCERLSGPGGSENPPGVARMRPSIDEDRARVGEREAEEDALGLEQGLVPEWEQGSDPVGR